MDCWEYSRTIVNTDSGSSVTEYLIDDNVALFVSTSAQAENVMYWGCRRGILSLLGRQPMTGTYFSKMWEENGKTETVNIMIEGRPLPLMRRPNSVCKLTVATSVPLS